MINLPSSSSRLQFTFFSAKERQEADEKKKKEKLLFFADAAISEKNRRQRTKKEKEEDEKKFVEKNYRNRPKASFGLLLEIGFFVTGKLRDKFNVVFFDAISVFLPISQRQNLTRISVTLLGFRDWGSWKS